MVIVLKSNVEDGVLMINDLFAHLIASFHRILLKLFITCYMLYGIHVNICT
jgi:hypothetical protein